MENLRKQLDKNGYILLKNFFSKEDINNLRLNAENIFKIQIKKHKCKGKDLKEQMIDLFQNHEEIFKNCGKLIQTGLIDLYRISIHNNLIIQLKELGINFPNMCTRPVLFFNHPQLAKSKEYYITPKHQDWPSMEASMNSIVVWVPLVDVNKENGSIILYSGSHKLGVLPFSIEEGFAKVEHEGEPIQPEMEVGDIALFSTLLIHESGPILNDSIRWSCHFRYTDMLDGEFIERGFPNPYIYKPITKQ
jgi:ectoine hydroxylase-related dioxygenase (phytanoyl-CoA dioxygenase family)